MTVWIVVGVCLGMAAYAVAWFRGGRTERFAAAVMLLHFAVAAMSVIYMWEQNGIDLPRKIDDYVRLLIFVWLCFRSNRWWPILMTTGLVLMVLVDVVVLLDPAISRMGAVSAQVGLGYLVDLTLLFSVCERKLAGEAPAGRAAWARANIATAARRRRKKAGCHSKADPAPLEKEQTERPQGPVPHLPA